MECRNLLPGMNKLCITRLPVSTYLPSSRLIPTLVPAHHQAPLPVSQASQNGSAPRAPGVVMEIPGEGVLGLLLVSLFPSSPPPLAHFT